MKIAVLVKQVPDTWSDRRLDVAALRLDRAASDAVIDEIGERAMEAALLVKDVDKSTEIVAVTMGPDAAADVLRTSLAMGADSAVHVLDPALAGADYLTTARALAEALRSGGFDLVIAGNQSTDGRGGVVPAMVAELLGLPLLSNLDTVEVAEGTVSGVRSTEGLTQNVHALLPALVSVTERANEPRFPSIKGIMGAKKKPVRTLTADDVRSPAEAASGRSVVLSAVERPARAAGVVVVDDGTAAAALVEFLAAGRLI